MRRSEVMTIQDQVILALTAWRENRGGGTQGMQSVMNVILNRSIKRGTDAYTESVRPQQFSSLTAKGDPELTLYPADNDHQWQEALALASQAAAGTLEDITGGAISYYALSMPTPPYWAASMKQTATIEGQVFLREYAV
jgi:spore germination cell wall hydrolase CwlJ-like protein